MKNMSKKPLAFIIGSRPNAIKMAPIYLEAKKQNLNPVLINTGQQRELSENSLQMFGLKSDINLNIMTKNQSLAEITSRILTRLPQFFAQNNPSIVVVQGDTLSDSTAALAAYYAKLPVAHVEAGLRSFDKYNPFPEEISRRIIDQIADIHFPPTKQALENLRQENIHLQSDAITGNTGIDALVYMLNKIKGSTSEKIDNSKMRLLFTCHRRESWDKHIEQIFIAVAECAQILNVEIDFPAHPNPLIQELIKKHLSGISNIHILPPADYPEMTALLTKADLIVTDSGGIQEEATYLGIPTLVVRDTTERPEGVKAGVLKVVGRSRDKIVSEVSRLVENKDEYHSMSIPSNAYGNGSASIKIVKKLKEYLRYE